VAFHFGFFTAIRDKPAIELTPGGKIFEEVPFDLQDDTTLGAGGVLTFMTDAVSPNNLTYTMAINEREVINRRVDSAVLHSEQEVVQGGNPITLKHGGNELQIAVTGGTGTLRIRDIVLHYVRVS
jgi:hypothetical protein